MLFALHPNMKRITIIISLLFILMIPELKAQDYGSVLKSIEQMGSARIEYSVTGTNDKGKQFINESGLLEIQGMCYKLHLNYLQVYCDGTDRRLYSPETMELVIMRNDMTSTNPMDNPLMFLSSSDVKTGPDGVMTINYKGNDGSTFVVKVFKIVKNESAWPADYFVLNEDTLSEDVIITDLR